MTGERAAMKGRPLRVARVIGRLNVGGPARHVVWLTEALDGAHFESILVSGVVPAGEEEMTGFAAEHGVEPIVIRQMSREISPADLVTVARLLALFLRFQPDVIETHTAKAGAVGRTAGLLYRWLLALRGKRRKVALIHTFHGHVFHGYYGRVKTSLFLGIERALARVTDAIVVLSEQQRSEILQRYRVGRPAQFRVVPLGIDFAEVATSPSLRERQRASLGIAPAANVVAIVGRLAPVKNHRLFLRVAARVLAAEPAARFVVYGDGAERAALETLAAESSARGAVIFAGNCDARAVYSSADLVVLTSLNEGTPLALLEAMANGIPVASTNVGGVVDLLGPVLETVAVADGGPYEIRERGMAAATGDEAALAAAVVRLLQDRELARTSAETARRHVLLHYAKDRLVADISALYREVSGAGRA